MKLEFYLMLKCSKQLLSLFERKGNSRRGSALAEVHHAIWPHPRSPFLLVVENLFCLHSVRIFWVARESWKIRSFRAYSCVSQTKLHGAQFWLKLCHDCSCKERMTAHSFIKKKRRGGDREKVHHFHVCSQSRSGLCLTQSSSHKKNLSASFKKKTIAVNPNFLCFFFFCYSSSSV